MNENGRERQDDASTGTISDESLRAILGSYSVVEPSQDFVADTLLRIQMDQHSIPRPSEDFVDRVVCAWADEQAGRPQTEVLSEVLVPVVPFARQSGQELSLSRTELGLAGQRRASLFPMALALVGFAAALALAFFVGRQSASSSVLSDENLVRIEDFPSRGSNRFARSLSLIVDRVDNDLLGNQRPGQTGPAYPRPVLSLPAPPSSLIPSAAVELHVDRATLESLGIAWEQL